MCVVKPYIYLTFDQCLIMQLDAIVKLPRKKFFDKGTGRTVFLLFFFSFRIIIYKNIKKTMKITHDKL